MKVRSYIIIKFLSSLVKPNTNVTTPSDHKRSWYSEKISARIEEN